MPYGVGLGMISFSMLIEKKHLYTYAKMGKCTDIEYYSYSSTEQKQK